MCRLHIRHFLPSHPEKSAYSRLKIPTTHESKMDVSNFELFGKKPAYFYFQMKKAGSFKRHQNLLPKMFINRFFQFTGLMTSRFRGHLKLDFMSYHCELIVISCLASFRLEFPSTEISRQHTQSCTAHANRKELDPYPSSTRNYLFVILSYLVDLNFVFKKFRLKKLSYNLFGHRAKHYNGQTEITFGTIISV